MGGVVEQVGDQAKQLGRRLSVHADVVLNDPNGHGGAAAGQGGQVGPVLGEQAASGRNPRLLALRVRFPGGLVDGCALGHVGRRSR